MQNKLLFLIPDGMGDYPLEELEGLTPLQAAHTPHMDLLARKSRLGRCRTIPPGQPPGSDIANMSLLGFDPATYHTGRGPIEAQAQGLNTESEDLIFRLNLCTVSSFGPEGLMLDHSGGHIDTDKAREFLQRLAGQIPGEHGISLVPGVQYRHLLIQRGGTTALEAGLRIRPPHDILEQELASDLLEYSRSPVLQELMHRAFELLKNQDVGGANAVWLWGQGAPLRLPSLREVYGLSGAVISAVDLIKGLGRSAGLELLEVPGATGRMDTDYLGKAAAARDFLQRGDFVYLHLEGPDECSHAGATGDKIRCIERFDREILGELLPFLEQHGIGCLVACDHLTPLSLRTHSRDPVPFLFYDPLAPVQGTSSFSEEEAGRSHWPFLEGTELLPWILTKKEATA